MDEHDSNPIVIKARMQAAYLIELSITGQDSKIPPLLNGMPGNEVWPLLGALLNFATASMKSQFGEEEALKQLEAVRYINGKLSDPDFRN